MMLREFRAVLTAQARYTAPVVALTTVVMAMLPLLTVQGIASDAHSWTEGRTGLLLQQSQFFAVFYPGLALGLGGLFAAANWLPDANGKWVYAFTLPVGRTRLAAFRLGVGAILMLPAMLSLWLVGTLAAQVADIPPVLQAHPGVLALRFGAATLVSYAAASLLTLLGRRAWFVALVAVILLMLQGFGVPLWGKVMDALFLSPWSPLHALAGQWMYLDV